MKKHVLAASIALSFMFGGVAGAAVYHIHDARERIQKETHQYIDEYFAEMDEKIKNDTMGITRQEIERMEKEVRQYTDQKLAQIYQPELNKKTEYIKKTADIQINELKKDVDEYIQYKLQERYGHIGEYK